MRTNSPWRKDNVTRISMNRASRDKDSERRKLAQDVEAFLSRGGQVQRVEFGVMKGPLF